jgi:hypothetical protein
VRFDTWRAFGWYMVAGIGLALVCLAVGLITRTI